MLLREATAPEESSSTAEATAPIVVPFVRSAKEHREPFHDRTTQIGGNSVAVGPVDVAPFGFARHVVLMVETDGTGAGGGAVAANDAPWNVLQNVTLTDVNGRPIVSPMSGFDLRMINMVGAYTQGVYDPADLPSFSGVDADGEFSFKLRIPIEITGKNGLGALPNMHAGSTYKVNYNIADEATIYTTAPATTTPGVRVRMWLEAWTQPAPTSMEGSAQEQNPPHVGTSQFWSKQQVNISPGEQTIRLSRVGNHIRNLLFVFRNDAATPVRLSAEFPDPVRLNWETRLLDNVSRLVLQDQFKERYGIALPAGCFVWDFTHDADGRPGNEDRHMYLPTSQATRLELQGTFGGGGILDILTNDIAPISAPAV